MSSSVVCWENADVLVSGRYWLGWTVNRPLGINSDVSSGYFIFMSSLRLPRTARFKRQPDPRLEFVQNSRLLLSQFSLFLDALLPS